MKKSLLALAALTAFAGVASAQSSVTLFGIVDASARSVDNDGTGTVYSLASGGGGTSRLGFRGIEDLGGGLRAGFWLEGQVDTDTGGAGFNFQRRATVSLIGGFGELRLGRDFTSTYLNWGAADVFGYTGVANSGNVRGTYLGQGSIATAVRTNNQIIYILPAMGGLYGQINVGLGEGTGDKYTGGRLGYAAGPLNIGAGYGKTERGVAELESMNISGSFNIGFARLFAGYENSEYSSGATRNDMDLYTVAFTIPMGKGTFKGQYTEADSSDNSYDASMFGLGYTYSMSKRTTLYASYGTIDNDSGNRYKLDARAVSAGGKSTGYEFGINHTF